VTSGVLQAVLVFAAAPLQAQSEARVSFDSVVAVDLFQGQNTTNRPNIIVDATAVVRLGEGWLVYVRPWFRQPRAPEWEKEVYQAALQHERPGRVATRIDVGYIVSPIGIGMMDSRPGVNPTIASHPSYFSSMPAFDPGAPRIRPIASSYPLGGQLSLSTSLWDARIALVNSAPTRAYVINNQDNPAATPVIVAGAGVTPTVGLRLGLSLARGAHATGEELGNPGGPGRGLTMIGFEGEYAFRFTKLTGELIRDHLQTALGHETAWVWFVQGAHTLSPRWFIAARQEGASAPPLRTATPTRPRATMQATEATVGFRLTTDFTLRGSFMSRKAYTRPMWDQQVGASLVWARRWW
jgi:hypothetical protein